MRKHLQPDDVMIDAMTDEPHPSQRQLSRLLQKAQVRWTSSRGKDRDKAFAEMLRLSKQMDETS
jgi:hypothetical protein